MVEDRLRGLIRSAYVTNTDSPDGETLQYARRPTSNRWATPAIVAERIISGLSGGIIAVSVFTMICVLVRRQSPGLDSMAQLSMAAETLLSIAGAVFGAVLILVASATRRRVCGEAERFRGIRRVAVLIGILCGLGRCSMLSWM